MNNAQANGPLDNHRESALTQHARITYTPAFSPEDSSWVVAMPDGTMVGFKWWHDARRYCYSNGLIPNVTKTIASGRPL